MATSVKFAVGMLFALLLIAAVGLLLIVKGSGPEICPLCDRGIHKESRAVIEVKGKRRSVCCVRCAITAEAQEDAPVKLREVSDFATGSRLRPESAYYVANTPVVLCERHQAPMDEHKRSYVRVFDRCEPSIFAFAREEDARAFAAHKGGEVRRLEEVIQKYGVRP